MEPFADAFAGKGDYAMAAAVRAELFLSFGGVYSSGRTVERFYSVLADAEKVGLREKVRAALVHALETGWNPQPIVTWKLTEMKEGPVFRIPPKRAEHPFLANAAEAPEWPLPWANEGVRLFDSRWNDFSRGCEEDYEFLLQLALVEGDKGEIARRFCDLPSFPHDEGLQERVKDAMKGLRPDIVEVIVLHGKGMSRLREIRSLQ